MQGELENNCPDQKPSTTPAEQSPTQSPIKSQTENEVIDLNQSESNKTIVQRDTFFNVMQHTFEGVNLERNTQSGLMEIPTEPFLLASGDFLPILDKLGSKAFQPVKMDIRDEFFIFNFFSFPVFFLNSSKVAIFQKFESNFKPMKQSFRLCNQ